MLSRKDRQLSPSGSLPIAQSFGCLDCGRSSLINPLNQCEYCGSFNVLPLAELWDQMKAQVAAKGGKARLVFPLRFPLIGQLPTPKEPAI